MNDIELIDEIVKRAEEHQKQKEKEFTIAELEKIKAEISDRIIQNFIDHDSKFIEERQVYAIIDNHIAELKGENNEP